MYLVVSSLRFDLNVANAFANSVSSEQKSATIWICNAHTCKADRIQCASSAAQSILLTDIKQILSAEHKYCYHCFASRDRGLQDVGLGQYYIGISVHISDIIGFGVWSLWKDDDKNG